MLGMIKVFKYLHSTMRVPRRAALIISVAAAVAFVPSAPRADYESALANFGRGDIASALQEWERLAQRDDPKSQFALGQLYEKGLAVAKDHNKAVSWYRKSAMNGYPPAQTVLGQMYFWGSAYRQHVLAKNYAEAIKWFRLAAE